MIFELTVLDSNDRTFKSHFRLQFIVVYIKGVTSLLPTHVAYLFRYNQRLPQSPPAFLSSRGSTPHLPTAMANHLNCYAVADAHKYLQACTAPP